MTQRYKGYTITTTPTATFTEWEIRRGNLYAAGYGRESERDLIYSAMKLIDQDFETPMLESLRLIKNTFGDRDGR